VEGCGIASAQMSSIVEGAAQTKGVKLIQPDLTPLSQPEITQLGMMLFPQQVRRYAEPSPENNSVLDDLVLKQVHLSSDIDGATTLDMKNTTTLCGEGQAAFDGSQRAHIDIPSSPLVNDKCLTIRAPSLQGASSSRNNTLSSFTEDDMESGEEEITGSLQDFYFSDFSTFSNEALLSQDRLKDNLARPVLSQMKQELIERIMTEFWAIFDQRIPLTQHELPQSPIEDTRAKTEQDGLQWVTDLPDEYRTYPSMQATRGHGGGPTMPTMRRFWL
jgi:hypothetical protein